SGRARALFCSAPAADAKSSGKESGRGLTVKLGPGRAELERPPEPVRGPSVAERLVELMRGFALWPDRAGQLDTLAALAPGQVAGVGGVAGGRVAGAFHQTAADAVPASRVAHDQGGDPGQWP